MRHNFLFLFLIGLVSINLDLGRLHAHTQGFHLLAGPSIGIIDLRATHAREVTYASGGIFTAGGLYGENWGVGVKSLASLGAHNESEGFHLSDSSAPLRRYVQQVNFTPYLHYRWIVTSTIPYVLFLEGGSTGSLTSFPHQDEHDPETGLKLKKTTIQASGLDLSIGYLQNSSLIEKTQEIPLFFAFSYQNMTPGRHRLVDVSDFSDALTLIRWKRRDVRKLHTFSFVLGFYLF